MAFIPGQSGNPGGRPKGSKNSSARIREGLAKELPNILRKLTAQALEGDTAAARLILDRALPPLRPESATVRIPGAQGASLADRAGAALVAIAAGELPPDVGAMILSAMASTVRVIEVADIARRLELLEVGREPG